MQEAFNFLLDLGVKKIESGIDYYCDWSDEDIQGLKKQIQKVFELYKTHIQKRQEVIFLESMGTISPFFFITMSVLCM